MSLIVIYQKLWPIYSMVYTIHFMRNIFASHLFWKSKRAQAKKKITLKVYCKSQFTIEFCCCFLFSFHSDNFHCANRFLLSFDERKKINFLKLVAKIIRNTWNFVKNGYFQVNLKYVFDTLLFKASVSFFVLS